MKVPNSQIPCSDRKVALVAGEMSSVEAEAKGDGVPPKLGQGRGFRAKEVKAVRAASKTISLDAQSDLSLALPLWAGSLVVGVQDGTCMQQYSLLLPRSFDQEKDFLV